MTSEDSGEELDLTQMPMEGEYPDFTIPDEMSSVTFILEDHKLYAHREILAAWSPVFRYAELYNYATI